MGTTFSKDDPVTGSRLQELTHGSESAQLQAPADMPPLLLAANEALRAGKPTEGLRLLEEACKGPVVELIDRDSTRTDVMFVAAKLWEQLGEFKQAEPWYRRILTQETDTRVLTALGRICEKLEGRVIEALDFRQRALEREPDNIDLQVRYAQALCTAGRLEEGMTYFHQALQEAPDSVPIQLMALWNCHYLPDYDRAFFAQAYQRVGRQSLDVDCDIPPHTNARDPEKTLKVGIMAADFVENSPATHFAPIWELSDASRVRFHAYANVTSPNVGTEAFRRLFAGYYDISHLSDDQTAELIRSHEIDILLSFGGYCYGNRTPVLIRKPAPIQVDFGGLSTLGLPQVDYRLTDAFLDPPEAQPYHSEKLAPMPGGFVTYAPPTESPLVGPLPMSQNGFVTLGAFNNHTKINEQVFAAWVQILQTLPEARLVLKFSGARDAALRQWYMDRFQQQGIASERVFIWGKTDYQQHLELLGQMDLLLDTFPYNGFRTTLEGLWMGVPTVTMMGDTFVSRMGTAVYKPLGLEIFSADSVQTYVGKTCAFAQQPEALKTIRRSSRELLLKSSICDPQRYALETEKVLRGMWRRYCLD